MKPRRHALPLLRPATALMLALGLTAAAPWPAAAANGQTATAIFAGGCFWCTESDFEHVAGVLSAESGYIGGSKANPTYKEVSAGGTGHAEAVRVVYDPDRVTYAQLLDRYWHSIDPTVKDQQFCDHGHQYRSAIFPLDAAQKQAAEASRDALARSGRFPRIYTEIVAASTFYPAEDYHQDYYKKNPVRYKVYRFSCGRDQRLEEVWGAAR